jgi:DNA-directed RNA polymerase III subunit RPC6
MPPVNSKKRSAIAISAVSRGDAVSDATKKIRAGIVALKKEEEQAVVAPLPTVPAVPDVAELADSAASAVLKDSFIRLFTQEEFKGGISNSALKEKFGDKDYLRLAPIINELTSASKLSMSKTSDGELFYTLVSDEVASKFTGLDVSARMVYQVIERAGNMGIWTKDIRIQTNIQQQALNKIFKALEGRRLIKPVKSVTAKAKKLYMLYSLTPAKELTGGVWYSDLEFDHEFISELRTFLLHCVRRLNGGRGVTLAEIRDKMIQANVSRVQLSLEEVKQIVQTLVYDYMVEETADAETGDALFIAAKRITPMCEFKWWDALAPDFHFRTVRFEDGVILGPHELHYHSV